MKPYYAPTWKALAWKMRWAVPISLVLWALIIWGVGKAWGGDNSVWSSSYDLDCCKWVVTTSRDKSIIGEELYYDEQGIYDNAHYEFWCSCINFSGFAYTPAPVDIRPENYVHIYNPELVIIHIDGQEINLAEWMRKSLLFTEPTACLLLHPDLDMDKVLRCWDFERLVKPNPR